VTGVDIAPEMIAKARELDPGGDYRLIQATDLSEFQTGRYDLVLSVFTFDNILGFETKVRLFHDLGALLNASGNLVSVVSSPEIYLHEWASFSTKEYPENRFARSGDVVRIITKDFADRRPAENILWTDESYRDVYGVASLELVATYNPLAKGDEPYKWVNETRVAPWIIYVLARQAAVECLALLDNCCKQPINQTVFDARDSPSRLTIVRPPKVGVMCCSGEIQFGHSPLGPASACIHVPFGRLHGGMA
jgi:hypothetical protein